MSQHQQYVMKEYDSFTRNVTLSSTRYHSLPEAVFDRLEQFILSKKQETDTEVLELMSLSSKRGIGKVISAKNYVGLITMSDGTVIEILPKLYSQDQESSEEETKRIFLNMLKFVKDIPAKTFQLSSLQIEKNNILEIFIRMFIEEAFSLIKHGLKSSYVEHQDNEFFLKGKLNFSKHIQANVAHKERFYIQYDLFRLNRVENKLIKTTLEFLRKTSTNRKNIKDLRTLLTAFEQVDVSTQIEQDFTQITSDRSMKEYATLLEWCRIFLQKNSFTTFKGNGVAYALLFPMEKVFESYVAGKLRKALDKSFAIKTQDRRHHLFDQPKRFLLKPDIVVKNEESTIVLDTKWKLLNAHQNNYGVSQADMYQAYAYSTKYNAKRVFLLYPFTHHCSHLAKSPITYQNSNGVTVCIGFIDLLKIDQSIHTLVQQIEKIMTRQS